MNITEIPQINNNIFQCITMYDNNTKHSNETTLIGYNLTSIAKENSIGYFNFVNEFFNKDYIAFSNNQIDILSLANSLFLNSTPMNDIEEKVLQKTLERTSIYKPTLPGRK